MKKGKGYSLAEVLIALGLCAVAVMAALALSISAFQGNQKSSDLLVAESLAQQSCQMFIYGLPTSAGDPFWGDPPGTSPVFASPYQPVTTQALGNTTYTTGIYVTDLYSASTTPGLRQVRVVVAWGSGEAGRAGSGIQATEVTQLVSAP